GLDGLAGGRVAVDVVVGDADGVAVGLAAGEVEAALADGVEPEVDPPHAGLGLGGRRLGVDHEGFAAAERRLGLGEAGDPVVGGAAAELVDHVGDDVGGAEHHADLAAAHGHHERLPADQEFAAHAVVDPAHVVQGLQDGLAFGRVEGRLGAIGGEDAAAAAVDGLGEVPAAGVAAGVLAVADVAGAERGDRLGGLADLGPGGGRGGGVEAGLGEELAVVDEADAVVDVGDAVDLAVVGDELADVGTEVVPVLDLAGVRGDVEGLALPDDVVVVGDGDDEDGLHLAAGELGAERLGVEAGLLVGALDRDARVRLHEGGHVVVPGLALLGRGLGGLAGAGDGDLCGPAGGGSLLAGAAGGESERGCD